MLSVVTPLSATGNPFVADTWRTLRDQTVSAWEWIVVLNNGGELPPEAASDSRVRVLESASTWIGELKGFGCRAARGDLIVELDHDDLLAADALERVELEFSRTGADFVFSDFAEFHDETWEPNVYSEVFGWRTYPVDFEGHALLAMRAPPATAQNIRRVEWAPNHVRAWRRDSYARLGGHRSMPVGDDHDLIVRGALDGWRFAHVPRCLYFYRVHRGQAVKTHNAAIQTSTRETYLAHVLELAKLFAKAHGLRSIELCGGALAPDGFESLDLLTGVDLNKSWPVGDGEVGCLRAVDALEHLRDPVHVMNEAHRVLAPGGFFLIEVPSTDGRGAFQDPTHVSFWNANSFWYYTRSTHARYLPQSFARFQAIHIEDHFPSSFHRMHSIPYTRAHLLALKGDFAPMGEVLI
jgi:O-antigen biosynthesis protein